MGWKALALLSLIFLGAAAAPPAAPPADCTPTPDFGQPLPSPLDLARGSLAPNGYSSQTLSTSPAGEAPAECQNALLPPSRSDTLGSQSGDVLHGLPASDVLRRIDQPRQAPVFQ